MIDSSLARLLRVICCAALIAAGCGDDDDDDVTTPDAAPTADASAPDAAPAGWQLIGAQVSPPGAEAEDPAMLLVDGAPAVGYRHASFELALQRFDGAQWGTSEPDPSDGNTSASIYRSPDFCALGGAVYAGYTHLGDASASDATFYDRVFLLRWDRGSSWQVMNAGAEISQGLDVGGVGYDADEVSVACSPGRDVAVAWSETDLTADGDLDVFVGTADASSATRSDRIDRNATAGTDTRTLDVELAGDGDRVVAHFEHSADASFDTNLYVTRYDGSVITSVGGVLDVDTDSNNLAPPSLVAVADDDIFVAWSAQRTGTASRDVFVAHYNGSEWSELGGGAVRATGNAHFDSQGPDLILIDGVPTLAWAEADDDGWYIFVAQLVGGAWQLIGDRINVDVARDALDPSLAHDPASGTLYVAFEEMVDGYAAIFVKGRVL